MSQITSYPSTGPLAIQANGTFQASSDGNLQTLVGTRWELSDGREVILVSTGATAIQTAGLLVQDAPIVANHQGVVVTGFTAYSANGNTPATVSVGTNATALAINQYQGGFLLVDSGPGIGQTLKIASNSSVTSATAGTITLEDGPNTALTTSSTVCLIPPHGSNVVVNPTAPTGAPVGVTLYPLAAGQVAGGTSGIFTYGFVTSKGLSSALSDVTVATVGQSISPSTTTVGAVTLSSGTNATLTTVIGFANQTAVSAKARSVFLNL